MWTLQSLQAPFRTMSLTMSPDLSRGSGAKIDCELTDGITGVTVTVASVDRNRPPQSTPAAIASARNEANRKAAADMFSFLGERAPNPMRLGFASVIGRTTTNFKRCAGGRHTPIWGKRRWAVPGGRPARLKPLVRQSRTPRRQLEGGGPTPVRPAGTAAAPA